MSRFRGWMSAVPVAVLTVFFAAGCAPSLRMVHRSRAYFERCYAADFDAQIRRTERHACWVAWLDHYTSGQPRERIIYARTRVAAQGIENDALAMPGVDGASGTATYTRAAHVRVDVAPAPNAAVLDAAPGAQPDAIQSASVEVTLSSVDANGTGTSAPMAVTATVRRPRGPPSIPPPPLPAVPRRGSPACSPVCDPRFIVCVELCDPAHPDPCRDACTAEHRACGNACL